jgi:WD40 repeat protein/serine/threonine protein kinase
MTGPDDRSSALSPGSHDGDASLFEDLVEQFTDRLQAGEAVDVEALLAAHPAYAERLRRLLPSLELIAGLGQSAVAELRGTARPEVGPIDGLGVLGDFQLGREVGRGGMGVVYEAWQLSLNRRVALKVLPFAAAVDPRHLRRFHIEAQAAATLHHPNIVPVYSVGCERGVHYYAMQFIDGRTLADLVAELRGLDGLGTAERNPRDGHTFAQANELVSGSPGPSAGPDPATALPGSSPQSGSSTRSRAYHRTVARLGLQAAEALEHAHVQGIVHRDIKPSNLMVDGRGNLWVTDFGLARIQEDHGLTLSGDLLGTLRYMSPEQASARSVLIDHRTDIYSLGVTLYELLTLCSAFEGRSRAEVLRQVIQEEPAALRRLNPAVPRDLETVVRKAMDKDPAARYATAGALASDLHRFLEDQPIRARRPSLLDRAAKCLRRYRVAAVSAAATVVILLVTTAAAGLLVAAKERQRRDLAVAARDREAALRRQAEDLAEQGRQRLVQLNVAQGIHRIDEGDLSAALPWFVEVLRVDGRDPARAEAHRVLLATLLAQCPKPAHVWFGGSMDVRADGRAVFVPSGKTATIRGIDTGEPIGPPLRLECEVQFAVFHPDGRRVALAGMDHTTRIYEVSSGKAVTPPLAPQSPHPGVFNLVFSPDGQLLLTRDENGFRIWDAAAGKPITPWVPHEGPVGSAFSPDGRRVATAGTYHVQLWDARSGTPVGPPMRDESGIGWVTSFPLTCFSPDGRRLVTPSRTAQIWDTATGAPVTPPLRHSGYVNGAIFSPDGRSVATCSTDGTAQVWDASSGLKIGAPMQHNGEVNSVAFSPDGTRVLTASSDHTARIWDAATGRQLLPPLRHLAHVYLAAFLPDGRSVLTRSIDRTVRIWDLATAVPDGPRLLHTGPAYDVAFSPEGRTVATTGNDSKVRIWEAATGTPVGPALDHPTPYTGGWFSPDGRALLTTGRETTTGLSYAWIWDLVAHKVTAKLSGAQAPGLPTTQSRRSVAWSADGRHIAIASSPGSSREGDQVQIWDARTGKPTIAAISYRDNVQDLAFSPDGRLLATGCRPIVLNARSTGRVEIRVAATGALYRPPIAMPQPCTAVRFSPDGRRLAVASAKYLNAGEAQIWDVATGRPLTPPLGTTASVLSIDFSPDGRHLLAGTLDSAAYLWDAATGALGLPPMRHRALVDRAIFSRDGRRILSRCNPRGTDFTREPGSSYAQVWDAATGLPVTPPLPSERFITGADLSPDGRRVATADDSGAVLLRTLEPDRRPFDDLRRLAEVLSGTRLDASGAAISLQVEELRSAYEALRRRDPDLFTATAAQVSGWHYQQALACQAAGRWEAALAHLDRVDEPGLTSAGLQERRSFADNNLAWSLATHPDPRLRDPRRAVALAKRAVELGPESGRFRNTLGVACYRAGDWEAAIAALEKSMELLAGGAESFNTFFLAMAHWQLGEKEEARRWYDRAVAWMDKNQPQNDELKRFRAEAEAVLGPGDLPADVFAPP